MGGRSEKTDGGGWDGGREGDREWVILQVSCINTNNTTNLYHIYLYHVNFATQWLLDVHSHRG